MQANQSAEVLASDASIVNAFKMMKMIPPLIPAIRVIQLTSHLLNVGSPRQIRLELYEQWNRSTSEVPDVWLFVR